MNHDHDHEQTDKDIAEELHQPHWSRKFGLSRVTSIRDLTKYSQHLIERDFVKLTEAAQAEIARNYQPGDTVRITLYVEGERTV